GTRGQLKNLSEIGQICRIVTHCLFRCVRYLGYRLSVPAHHLHDDLQRLVAKIVGEVGTDSKRYLATAGKAAGKFDGTRKRKRVRKYQRLGPGVGTVCGVMRQQTFTPDEGIARIVTGTIKQLAKVHVEVAKERIHAVDVRQGYAQITTVFLGPDLEREYLGISQPGPQRLAG